MFDNSQNHHALPPDALNAKVLTIKDGGKNIEPQRNGFSQGVSFLNLINSLSVSHGPVEQNKIDKLLVSTSYAGVVATGISHLNLIN
jgi:hypothetical protein